MRAVLLIAAAVAIAFFLSEVFSSVPLPGQPTRVTCSMADQAACPHVGYADIRLPQDDTVADPYSMDFREPVWPEGLQPVPRLGGADWLMETKRG